MKKSEMLTMVVSELKALAKKLKVTLPVRAKKADIISALLTAAKKQKPAPKKTISAKSEKTAKPKTKKSPLRKPSRPAKPSGSVTPAHEWKLPPGVEEPLMAQERVAESKYYTGPALQALTATGGELPHDYGEEKITLMTRDPYVAYAYWETTPARLEREKAWFGWDAKLCVRIYDITGVQFDGKNAVGYYDQEVFEQVGNWYFDFGRPNHSFCADLGLLAPSGKFLTLARSNFVTMPRDGASDVIDEEWMLVDEEFWQLYGYAEGFRGGSSLGMREKEIRRRRIQQQRMQAITSPGLFSPGWTKTGRK